MGDFEVNNPPQLSDAIICVACKPGFREIKDNVTGVLVLECEEI